MQSVQHLCSAERGLKKKKVDIWILEKVVKAYRILLVYNINIVFQLWLAERASTSALMAAQWHSVHVCVCVCMCFCATHPFKAREGLLANRID